MGIKIWKKKNAVSIDEWKFTNQNWKRVLREIVDYAPNRYGRGKGNYGEDHPLVKHLKIKPHELMLIMSFLEDQGLIEYDKPEHNWINLTSKGFDVATQNQTQRTTVVTNRILAFLTGVIAFSAIVQLINTGVHWAIWSVIMVFFVVLGFILKKVIR